MGGDRHQLYRPGWHWAIYRGRWEGGHCWDFQNVAIAANVSHTTKTFFDAVKGIT